MIAARHASATDSYQKLYDEFRWHVPAEFNIATVCCHRWADDATRIAIRHENEAGNTSCLTYAQLQTQSNRLSNVMRALGIGDGDRVGIFLPQRPETAVAHIACYQSGAIAMPLSVLFGPDALESRLKNSEASIVIVDQAGLKQLNEIRSNCPALRYVIAIGCAATDVLDWDNALTKAPPDFQPVATRSSEPAILIYTSGTTGAPKGALLPHSAIIGNLTGFVASQNWFPQEDDVFWSPADWAWTGGLMDALLPTLYFGKTIISYHGRFSPAAAFHLMEKYQVTNAFLFPTALKMMSKTFPAPHEKFKLKLRAIMSAGEAVGDAVFNWSQSALGITINEMFGQSEMNYIVGNSSEKWPAKAGSMGRAYPGHRVAIIDEEGRPIQSDEGSEKIGEVALNRTDIHGHPDPVLFLGYWNNPEATQNKYSGDWCRTGDLASIDEDGYLWYRGRADDMFKAAGYRIGPSEIENCLLQHRAVANVAVVPKPDPTRGNIVKAFIVLAPGVKRNRAADDKLIADLQAHVRGKLAPYEYPKEIEFIEELPMTTNGKVQRRVLRQLEEERSHGH
ncbi:MAG: acyl-CoA synthetase [Burkholderiaceae bacterium]